MKARRLLIVILCASFLLSGWPFKKIFADEKTSNLEIEKGNFLTLGQVIEEALGGNQEIKAANLNWEAMKKKIPQASALQDPTFGYDLMGEMIQTRVGPEENVFEVEQMIPFPGKLIERKRIAVKEAEIAENDSKIARLDVVQKVSEAYYDLYITSEILSVMEDVKNIIKKLEALAQSRYASQGGTQRDVAKAQAEVTDMLQRIIVIRQQKETRVALMSALLDRNVAGSVDPLSEPKIPILLQNLEELILLALENRPEIQKIRSEIKKEEHSEILAKYEYIPDLSVGFQYIGIGNGETNDPNDGEDAWMIPLKINIPLWQNRLRLGVEEARKNIESKKAALKQAENMTTYEVKDAYYRFLSSKQVVDLYQTAMIPEAELAFRSDQAGYEGGRTDVLNLIDSERVYLNAKVSYYQVLGEMLKGYAALERAVGMDLDKREVKNEKGD